MGDELARYLIGSGSVSRRDREQERKKKAVHDRVNLAAYMVDGTMALAAHIMTEFDGLVDHQRATDQGDPVKLRINAKILEQAILDVNEIQRRVNSDFYGG